MQHAFEKIVYPGSDSYSPAEVSAPGSIPISLGGEPLVKAIDTAYIVFEMPDLNRQKAFLIDFGLHPVGTSDTTLYMRGHGTSPYVYVAHRGPKPRFIGAGFLVASRPDLERVSAETGAPIMPLSGPGGGEYVRLWDPDGFAVDLVFGRHCVAPLSAREASMPINLPRSKSRVNQGQRPPLEPSAIERFGHYVLMVTDFEQSWAWYRKYLGLLPTDIQCTVTGCPVLAFCRLDKGPTPADHHTVVLALGPSSKYLHSAYETTDLDAIGQGQQYLKSAGWKHFWGIGRHILGSQIFDYWLDPHGFEVEHYADGDVFDNSWQTQYHLIDRGGLWAWGDDVPAAMNVKPSLGDIWRVITGGAAWRSKILALKRAMSRPPRPWLK